MEEEKEKKSEGGLSIAAHSHKNTYRQKHQNIQDKIFLI